MYDVLAPLYDALFEDIEASRRWVSFVKKHSNGTKLMDLACGSGDIAQLLSIEEYEVLASDISEEMLEVSHSKYPELNTVHLDMRELEYVDEYNVITCFCDSLNYICDKTELRIHFKQVYDALKYEGTYIFDIHSLDRMKEFEEAYVECGNIEGVDYQWEIEVEDDNLYQQFAFYYPTKMLMESHVQKIWDPEFIIDALKTIGFDVECYTDFDKLGLQEGEKYFFVAKKGR